MNHHENHDCGIGYEIGTKAAGCTEEQAREFCTRERQRLECENGPEMSALRAKIAFLRQSAEELEERIRKAPPPIEQSARKRSVAFYCAIAVLLSAAAFIFTVIAFDPYRLGWKAWLYCLGIAIVTPFLVDRVLDSWGSINLLKAVQGIACVAALVSGLLLAVIRGNIFAEEITHDNPVVSLDMDDSPESSSLTPSEDKSQNFYVRTLGDLRLVMALLALAMELGAGLAVHEARRRSSVAEDAQVLRSRLKAIQEEMIAHGHALWSLENAGEAFENAFWRDFYHSLLTRTMTGAMRKLAIILLTVLSAAHLKAHAAERVDVVVLFDLSRSVVAKDGGGETEFQKNTTGVARVLASMPAGARVSVYGITDDSFGRPYPLLAAELPKDEGYFKERLALGRAELRRQWQRRSAALQPRFRNTDILGALLLASQRFDQDGRSDRKVLVILSDMRQSTPALDLDALDPVKVAVALRQMRSLAQAVNFRAVDVYVLGADAADKTPACWNELKTLWMDYFQRDGARLRSYSIFRESPF